MIRFKILLLTLFPAMLFSQNSHVQWLKDIGGSGNETSIKVAVDASGNVFVAGNFSSSSISIGTTTLVNHGNVGTTDFFVAKYDPGGNPLWAISGGGSGNDNVTSLSIDMSGNSYISGGFSSTSFTMNGTVFTNNGSANAFFMKVNASGQFAWGHSAGGSLTDGAAAVAVDPSGCSYFTGNFQSSITFGPYSFLTAGINDIFIVKYDPTGNVVWARKEGANVNDAPTAIKLDGLGNFYLSLWTSSPMLTIGTTTLSNRGVNPTSDFAIAKFDTSGNPLWAIGGGGTNNDYVTGLAVDSAGNCIASISSISLPVYFGSFGFSNSAPSDVFVAKISTNGAVQWMKGFTGTGNDVATTVSCDGSNIYACGYFTSSSLSFGSTVLSSAGLEDIFVTKLDDNGIVQWSQQYGSTGSDEGLDISATGNDQFVLVGSFASSSITFGSNVLSNMGGTDGFVEKTGTTSLNQGLVAYYPFNGNAIDSSGNLNNGSVSGAALTKDRFGNAGSAYAFTGNTSSIQIPHSSSFVFAGTRQFSMSAWVKINNYKHQVIAFKGAATGAPGYFCEWAIALEPDKTVRFKVNADAQNVTYSYLTSISTMPLNRWTHVVAIWDGTAPIMKFYVDDQPSGSIAAVSQMVSMPDQALYFGYVGDGPLDGALDDIRIYNRPLNQAEVDSLYHEGGWNGIGNLAVLVENGEDWGAAGANAHVRLYTKAGILFDSTTTNTNSIATFTGVPAGDGYYYKVDYVSTHPYPVVTRQFWGQRNGISISVGKTTNDIFTRNMPYATNIHAYNSLTNEDVSAKPVWPGTLLRIDLSAKNPSYTDAQTQSVKARVILDTNSTPPYLMDQINNYESIPVGTTAIMSFPYTPSLTGQYYDAGGLEVSLNGTDTYSEGFDSWNSPLFSVVTPVVTLLVPQNSAPSQSTSLTLRWNRVEGASTYQVQMGTDLSFSAPTVNDSTVTDTTRQVVGLANGTVYYWRVRALDAATKSAYAVPFSFTTVVSTPGVPALVTPADGAPSQTIPITVRWNSVASAIGYHVQLTSDPLFGSFVVNDSTVTDTTRLVSGLVNNTTYYWRVRTINSGGKSAFSTPYSFTTVVAAPGVPVLFSPADGATTQPVALNLRWSRILGASAYHLQVSSDAPFSALVVNDSTLADTTRLVSGLTNNATYYWRIQATNAGGKSAYATPYSFSTVVAAPGIPALLIPSNAAASEPVSLILRWTRVTGAVGYQVQLASDGFFGSLVVNDSTLIDTLRVLTGLENNTTYFWRARAINAGGSSGYAAPFSFTTIVASPSQVQLVRPPNGASIGHDSIQFAWNASVPEILSYEFSLIGDTTTVYMTTDTVLTLKIPASSTAKDFAWHVRAKNLAGFGLFSDTRTFERSITSVGMPSGVPKTYALYQNYPNPFNPTTRIRYALPTASNVTLTVYNTLGQAVLTVRQGYEGAGYYEVNLDGNNLASGVYFYRLQAGSFVQARKLLLLK